MARKITFLFTGTLILTGAVLRLLRLWGPGNPDPFVDDNGHPLPGSISEKIRVNVNGMQQGMFIRGKDVTNPVLLYVQGGSLPDYFLTERYPTDIEDYFTVCWWEQRGAGLSYKPHMPRETLTLEQFISDTLEVTNYLRHRFGKDKIYLMGHSGGTFFAIQAVARAPELFHAYIGMAQMVDQRKSERLVYEYMLMRFQESGNRAMVRKLEAAPVTIAGGTPPMYLALRDKAMHSLGIGTTHDMRSVLRGIIVPSLRSPKYTMGEKISLWRGKFASGPSILWDEMTTTDLAEQVTEFDLPVYFLQGIYDYTCSYALARAYFEKLRAPVKGFYTFEHSAHCPVFEEADKARGILQEDVLLGASRLADQANR